MNIRPKFAVLVAAAAAIGLLAPPTSSPSAPETRPHRATCEAVPDDPLALEVTVRGTCQATHLGHDSFASSHTVVPIAAPDGSGWLPILVLDGSGIHQAANGDVLLSAYTGTGHANVLTGRIEFEFDGTYTGGTGRFAGASGSTRISGALEGGVARATEIGTITY